MFVVATSGNFILGFDYSIRFFGLSKRLNQGNSDCFFELSRLFATNLYSKSQYVIARIIFTVPINSYRSNYSQLQWNSTLLH